MAIARAQFLGHPHVTLDHLDRAHALALGRVPEIVLDAGARVLPERDADSRDRVGQAERRLVGEEGTVRRATDQLHQVEGIGAAHAAAADAEEAVHRPHVVTLADQPLHEFEAVDVGQGEIRLDPVLRPAA